MAVPETDDGPIARRRKLFVYADALGMSREERIDLAEYVLRRDITSWKQLDDAQVLRLLDCYEGHALISHLLTERRKA